MLTLDHLRSIQCRRFPGILFLVAASLSTQRTTAEFEIFHEFEPPNISADDRIDVAAIGMAVIGSRLYGAATADVTTRWGAIFSVDLDGSDYRVEHDFATGVVPGGSAYLDNIVSDGRQIYGRTHFDGEFGRGTIFKFDPANRGFSTIYSFPAFTAHYSSTSLALIGEQLITFQQRADNRGGSFHSIGTDGSAYRHLFQLPGNLSLSSRFFVTDGEKLFGIALNGYGPSLRSVVYAVNLDGSGFEEIYVAPDGDELWTLKLIDSRLVGTGRTLTSTDVIFSIDTDGSDYRTLKEFTVPESGYYHSLMVHNSRMYGIGTLSDAFSRSILYSLNLDGSDYSLRYCQLLWMKNLVRRRLLGI